MYTKLLLSQALYIETKLKISTLIHPKNVTACKCWKSQDLLQRYKKSSIIPANYNEPVEILLPVPADKFLYHKADKNYFVHFTALQKPICEFS